MTEINLLNKTFEKLKLISIHIILTFILTYVIFINVLFQ